MSPDERYEYWTPLHTRGRSRSGARAMAECRKSSRHRERDHQQKADRDHQAEGAQTIDQECLEVRTRIRLHPPYRVQRGLELEERAGGGGDECDAADRGGEDPHSSLTHSIEKTLYGVRTLAPDKVIQLVNDLSAHRIGAEDQTRNSSCDKQYRRDRKQCVVGQCRAEAQCVVIPPRLEGDTEDSHDCRRATSASPAHCVTAVRCGSSAGWASVGG